MNVIGGEPPPEFPVNPNIGNAYDIYYSLDAGNNPPNAPDNLSANAVSSSQINLSWNDNSADETGFDVERSLDGVNFTLLTTTGADTTSYSDTGLAESTIYYYRVLAYNANGSSAYSATSSATTKSDVAGTSVEVGNIVVSTVSLGRGQRKGRAVVVVVDDQGAPVGGAVVSGDFAGDLNESKTSSATDGNGSTTMETTDGAKGVKSLSFCVTEISHPTLDDFTGNECSSL
jgi:hypothetical protein